VSSLASAAGPEKRRASRGWRDGKGKGEREGDPGRLRLKLRESEERLEPREGG